MTGWDATKTRSIERSEIQDLIDVSRLAAIQDGQRSAFDEFQAFGGVIYEGGSPAVPSTVFRTPGGVPYLDAPGVALLARPECPRAWMSRTEDVFDDAATRVVAAGSVAHAIAQPRGSDRYTFIVFGIDTATALQVQHPDVGLKCRRYPAARRFVIRREWSDVASYRARAERLIDDGVGAPEEPIVATGAVKAWRSFIESRLNRDADRPLQILVRQILCCFRLTEWYLFRDYFLDSNGDLHRVVGG